MLAFRGHFASKSRRYSTTMGRLCSIRHPPSAPLPPPARQLPLIRLHDLRRLHATLLLLEGVPVHVVANRLGHSDPSVTPR